MVLPEVGSEGQLALSAAKVLCVGAGGLGSPVLLYLAAAGIGEIGIIDGDRVEESNLQRQILFDHSSTGLFKAEAARVKVLAQNPDTKCTAYPCLLTAQNASQILAGYDLVIDGTDNFATKFLINDACAHLGIPWIYGSVNQWEGQVACFFAGKGPCYRCLYPTPPKAHVMNCAEAGVLGATVGVIGSWQAVHSLRILLPGLDKEWSKLQVINTLSGDQLTLKIGKNPNCATCSIEPSQIVLQNAETPANCMINASELLGAQNIYCFIDVRNLSEWNEGHLPGATLWPLSEFEKGKFPIKLLEEAKTKGIRPVLYCRGGARSQKAAEVLAQAGYPEVYQLKGGVSEWTSELECPQRA